ncbi:MAG: hypothetical protein GF387_01420 [Candidatus Portnoybacteria bacterium]|nr:hypothetical protein [Candidatus Portnoybacteria bacterium]
MDKFVVKKIKELKGIKPNASWLESQKSFLLSEISRDEAKKQEGILPLPAFNFAKLLRPAFLTALFLIMALSSVATVGAIGFAQNSLPGDMLYPLKTAFEKTQFTFTSDENKTRLSIKFADKRIDEFTQIVNKPEKREDANKTVEEFTAQLVNAQKEINELKEKNAEKAAEVAKIVQAQTERYKETLTETEARLAYVFPEEKELEQNINNAMEEISKTEEMTQALVGSEEDVEIINITETEETEEASESEEAIVPSEEEKPQSSSIEFEEIQEEPKEK